MEDPSSITRWLMKREEKSDDWRDQRWRHWRTFGLFKQEKSVSGSSPRRTVLGFGVMAPTAAALLALSVIYRLTINLPDLPYSYDLRKPGSTGFVETASNISLAVDELLAPVRGEHRPVVFQFR